MVYVGRKNEKKWDSQGNSSSRRVWPRTTLAIIVTGEAPVKRIPLLSEETPPDGAIRLSKVGPLVKKMGPKRAMTPIL